MVTSTCDLVLALLPVLIVVIFLLLESAVRAVLEIALVFLVVDVCSIEKLQTGQQLEDFASCLLVVGVDGIVKQVEVCETGQRLLYLTYVL